MAWTSERDFNFTITRGRRGHAYSFRFVYLIQAVTRCLGLNVWEVHKLLWIDTNPKVNIQIDSRRCATNAAKCIFSMGKTGGTEAAKCIFSMGKICGTKAAKCIFRIGKTGGTEAAKFVFSIGKTGGIDVAKFVFRIGKTGGTEAANAYSVSNWWY